MKETELYWNFKVWQAFSKKLYSECLNQDNLENDGMEEFYESMWKIEDGTLVEQSLQPITYRHLVKLSKGNEKYVLAHKDAQNLPIKVTATVPFQLKKSDKRVWKLVTGFQDMSIPAIKTMSFKQFIDQWNPVEHSHPEYFKLLKIIAIASRWKGVKVGLCSEPEAGKTSNYSLMGFISGDVGRITNPTIAKFESMMYYNRVLLPDEVPNWETKTIRDVESLMIAIADGSVEYTKHSKAQNKSMEKMDADNLSIIFGYNRPEDMKKNEKFFDEAWNNPGAIKSRYPQLLFKGRVTSKMPKLSDSEAVLIMENNFPIMASVAKNYTYFVNNLSKEFHNYDRKWVSQLSGRHASNMQGVIDAMDAYAETEMEFIELCALLNQAMEDYKKMVKDWKHGQDDEPKDAFDKYDGGSVTHVKVMK
jgi:hypothetical protein